MRAAALALLWGVALGLGWVLIQAIVVWTFSGEPS